MSPRIQRHLLERELELMSWFALQIASGLASGSEEERVALVQGLLRTSLKLSRLLWPFGRRAGDDLAAEEAAALRERLGIPDDHPLAPVRAPALAAALRLPAEELRTVLDLERELLIVAGTAFPLRQLVDAIRAVHHGVTTGTSRAPRDHWV
jgi:hypothetical protein